MPTKKVSKKTEAKKKPVAKKSLMPMEIKIAVTDDRAAIQAKLTTLAHQGTKEALNEIADFILKTEDADLRDFAEMALDEAEFLYYSPVNEQEEKDLLVAKMIKEHDEQLFSLISRYDCAKLELEKLEIEKDIDRKVCGVSKKGQEVKSESRFSAEYYAIVKEKMEKIEADIDYESAWIKEAEKMIKTEKFKDFPVDVLDKLHFDGEEGSLWEDDLADLDDDDDDEDCCCDECCSECGHGMDDLNDLIKPTNMPF